jgi:hypothetical protein
MKRRRKKECKKKRIANSKKERNRSQRIRNLEVKIQRARIEGKHGKKYLKMQKQKEIEGVKRL